MTWPDASPVQIAGAAGTVALTASLCVCFVRMAVGPTLADRVVALDMIATLLVGLLVLSGINDAQAYAIRVATLLALVNFLGTVAFAIHVRRKGGL